jgi:predicted N-acyltransferase
MMRTLMVGSPVGEGVLGSAGANSTSFARALADALVPAAERLRTPLIVLKEFPAECRPAFRVFLEGGYTRIPSMPYVSLDLDFADFEEHMRRSLSSSVRKDLRRKFRDTAAAAPLSMHVTNDISASVDELYPLYLQVYERSTLHFERLTPEYLARLGRDLPDRTRFFVWTQGGRPVAFNACTLHDGVLWAEYLGLDYRCALDLHLYFVVMRDEINWCCRNGVRRYCSTSLNYDPKLHLRFRLLPLDLYVRHVNGLVNWILGRAVPWLTPATRDATLRLFPNAADL